MHRLAVARLHNMFILSFYRNRKAALYAAYLLLSADSKPKVVRVASNQTDVSPAQRKRMEKVNKALQSGENPYTPDGTGKTPDAGGLESDRKSLEKIAVDRPIPDGVVRKWTDRPVVTNSARMFDAEELQGPATIGDFPTIKGANGKVMLDPDYRICSFCHTAVHISVVTLGVSNKLIKSRKYEHVPLGNGETVLQERVSHFTPRLVACPECVLRIEPTVDDDNNIVKNNTQINPLSWKKS